MSIQRQSQLANFTRGNNESQPWHGDNIDDHKENNHIRMMFQNVNGISLRGPEGFDMFINEQANLQVDVHCFSEHCLDTSKFTVTQAIRETLRTRFPGPSTIALSSSTEPAINTYKPGGTGLLVLGTHTSRIEPQGKGNDPMGRWSFCHMRRKDSPPVTIISIYQVCPRPTNLIGNTAYHQQRRALDAVGREIHPRQAFIQDLGTFVSQLKAKGHDIVLGGDFNETMEDRNSGLLRLATTHQLVDPFLHRFPHSTAFGTHLHGNRRIDSILVTPALLSCIHRLGYAPFYHARNSDHRPILIEFNSNALFGARVAPHTVNTRSVRSNDKKNVSRFISAWYDEVQSHGGFTLQRKLDNDSATLLEVESLDNIIGKSSDLAERKCRRRRPEFYSQLLVQQRLTVSILRGHLNALKMGKDRTPQLRQRLNRAGMEITLPETIGLTRMALQTACKNLRDTCKHDAETRQAELSAKIEEASALHNRPKEKILKAIRKVEDHRRTYKILQAMKRDTSQSSTLDRLEIPSSWPPTSENIDRLSQLEDPKTCVDWKVVTEPHEVEHYLMIRNRLHFGQAEGTPFTVEPLRNDIDWAASSAAADQLLQGHYTRTASIPNCQNLIDACKATARLDSLPPEITMQEFRGKLKVWRESTSTSPSGRHLGRYKSLFAPGEPDQSPTNGESLSLLSKQEALAALILSVINYCIRNNYVLTRWKTIINMMIFKEPGNYRIHKLRVIHIYEADFNLILAVKWRQLLRFADATDQLNFGQYGGRPGCEAQSLTLLEELKYDLAYLTRRTLFNFDNDATSCYDRIIVPLASVINRKYGLHRKVVAVHASTLQQAKFFLKTATGISSTHYSHCDQYPIHGTGQGSANSPCIWLFISSTLFDIHSSLAHGVKFITPDGKLSAAFSMVGFVDDSTGSYNDFRPQTEATLEELMTNMEHDAQIWNNLLYCSGGKLELSKCSFHVLTFEYKPNGRPVPNIDNHDDIIQILDHDTDVHIPIKSKRSFEPHKTLGHHKSPHAAQSRELQAISSKANRLAMLIATSPLSRQGAFLAYRTIFIPTIGYTLPQSFMEQATLDRAQSHSIGKILAKCGYNRNTTCALIYAPVSHAGGGFIPWYLLQGAGQIRHFLKHWRTDTVVSRTLRVALHWAQWQAGHEKAILEDTKTPIPFLECRWLKSLRNFLAKINAKIFLADPILVPAERGEDIYIMQYARESRLFNDNDLAVINYCRLYLHVTTVSELFDADGKWMIPELFQCTREPWFNPTTYISLQRRPTPYHIRTTWQKLCRQWATSTGQRAASIDLGRWTTKGHLLRRRRQTYLVQQQRRYIYHWRENCYWRYQQDPLVPTVYHPESATHWEPLDPCIPITATQHHNGQISTTTLVVTHPPCTRSGDPPSDTFARYIHALPEWEAILLDGIEFKTPPREICSYISNMTESMKIYLVSDGSVQHQIMTYAWVLGTEEGKVLAQHSGSGFGDPTSHRAEAWGMLSGLRFLHRLYTYTTAPADQSPRNVLVYADNAGLITRVNSRLQYNSVYPNATLKPDWDIVEQIHSTIVHTPAALLSIAWVQGHQDDYCEDLPLEAQFNVQADALARAYTATDTSPKDWHLPAARCTLAINDRAIHSNYQNEIYQAYTLPSLFSYLEQKHQWTPDQKQQVDWEVLTRAVNSITLRPVQLLKLVHDKLPTGHERAKSNQSYDATCHYCHERETFLHLLRCNNPTSTRFRQNVIDSMTSYMQQRQTPDRFQQQWLRSIEEGLQPSVPQRPLIAEHHCQDSQQRIGCHLQLRGFVSKEWRKFYDDISEDYQAADELARDKPTSLDLVTGLVKLLWEAQHQLWEAHLTEINSCNDSTKGITADKLHECKVKIRWLHQQKDKCLHGHRDHYFYQDVEAFLDTATGLQMRNYLHHYEPAILRSIAQAQKDPIRSILTFQGFHRVRPPNTTPQTHPGHSHPPLPQRQDNMRGSITHRKHTRWKTLHKSMTSIKSFFAPKPPGP